MRMKALPFMKESVQDNVQVLSLEASNEIERKFLANLRRSLLTQKKRAILSGILKENA